MSNSPGAVPCLPQVLMNFPSLENFTMRALVSPPWPSRDEDVAVRRDVDVGRPLKVSGPSPATPGLPSVIRTLPSGLNLKTVWPLPSLPMLVGHPHVALAGRRGARAGQMNIRRRSSSRACRTHRTSGSAPGWSRRSRWRRSGRRPRCSCRRDRCPTPIVDPHLRPSGSFAQFSSMRRDWARRWGRWLGRRPDRRQRRQRERCDPQHECHATCSPHGTSSLRFFALIDHVKCWTRETAPLVLDVFHRSAWWRPPLRKCCPWRRQRCLRRRSWSWPSPPGRG